MTSEVAAEGPSQARGPRERRPGGRKYGTLPPQVNLAAMERDVLQLWARTKVFERALDRGADAPTWVFYEGPPTANGRPGTHHVEARVFKDLFPRYKTMSGFRVPRKAGWDCHGLPVELAVEKELGFTGKADIEAYGVAEFNARCRESVLRHVDAFEELTTRMGYWVDMGDPYRTMDAEYIESVWWSLQQVYAKGLLVEDHRITPYCPRCGTGLSDHELGQPGAYETVVDPSVYVRFPVTDGPLADFGAALLVWTTTPWTLVSNTAVAVHPEVGYVAARAAGSEEVLVVAEPLVAAVLGPAHEVLTTLPGSELAGTRYRRPFDLVDWPEGADGHFVVLADYVTTSDGTGLVHQSPAFGEEDLRVARAYGLPVVNPVRRDGTFEADVPLVGGLFFKKADEVLVRDLEARGLLFRHLEYEHAYPHCWRCHTPLMYYALPSWYIRTTAIKEALLRENERTRWFPDTVQWGRYGDWLRNNVDWALSRSRYWGTPLPIWRCPEGHLTCVGSRAELGELTGVDQSGLDLHRPFVDEITFGCPTAGAAGGRCGLAASRVPEVIDSWYDSGSMPFAQWGYPFAPGSEAMLDEAYPAQFICEGLDQTRGWFYTLMAIGTLVFDRSSYENVLCLGLIMAEDGRKMSKHLGNILEPMPLMEEHGADALRWFMACSGSAWGPRRIGPVGLREIVRKVLLTYWNTASFLTLYGRTAGWTPADGAPEPADRPLMDQWALAELASVVEDVTSALDGFDAQRAGQRISGFVDDVSNWYVRRSRRRFWAGDPAALATLHTCVETLTRLMAPIVPFITEQVWQDVVRPVSEEAEDSVHLAVWPGSGLDVARKAAASVDSAGADDVSPEPGSQGAGDEERGAASAVAAHRSTLDLQAQMALVRRLVELGRAARSQSGVRTRQPLARALVFASGWDGVAPELRAELADELNVAEIATADGDVTALVDVSVKANFRALGRRFGPRTPAVAAAIAAADGPALATALRSGSAEVTVDGEPVPVGSEEVVISESPREGWTVVSAEGESVGLDLALTDELLAAGLAREVVRAVQEARKVAGLDVSDRIDVRWASGEASTVTALAAHGATVCDEVLAVSLERVDAAPEGDWSTRTVEELGLTVWFTRADA